MAVKNLQTLALCVANKRGVRVTGMECNGSPMTDGKFQAHFLSLLWHPLPGPYPIRTGPDTKLETPDQRSLAEANTVQRTGRSRGRAGVHSSTSVARCASTTVLSTRGSLLRTAMSKSGLGRLAKRSTDRVLG